MSAPVKADASLADWHSQREARVASHFIAHEASVIRRTFPTDLQPIDALKWAKPGTSIYRIDYLCDGPRLFVTGDMYDAIYIAGAPLGGGGLAWWAGCHLDYFASKCMASPSGRGFKVWDAEYAQCNLRQRFEQEERDFSTGWSRRDVFAELSGWENLGSQFDWSQWLSENGSEVWDDYGEEYNVGVVIDDLCLAHLRGLQLACTKLGLTVAR